MTEQSRRNFFCLGSIIVVAGLALLPWWHNHSYLRDLYDYGLVVAANGHLNLGERPYVDFTTPIQAGFLGLSWLVERVFGGTYFALTLGGAGLIVATSTLLIAMLGRRWPWWAAAVVGGAVTVAGASQHTILWHNALGVFGLALVTWSAACAPVWRRATWPWHALMMAGLFLGGINKLNFQLVATAVALAWTLRAGLVRSAGWGRVAATALGILVVGVVLPVASELAWTGASLSLWLANVVQLASSSRLEILREILSVKFLFEPIHPYYGEPPLPQVGFVGVLVSVMALAGCWPGRKAPGGAARWDRWLVPVAAGLAGAAGAALLATNFEIASLGLGAWLVLVVSLWLGFPATGRRAFFAGGLIVPAVLIALAAWWSAWLGQRSQFGYSPALRADYRPAESAGPAFAYLHGLNLPPEVMQSLEVVEQLLPPPDEQGRRPVFYGPGLEYVHRAFPSRWEKRQPLWAHWGTSYGPADIARLGANLEEDGRYQMAVATLAFDTWPDSVRNVLQAHYVKGLMGPVFRRWLWWDRDAVNLNDSFDTLSRLGGNVDGRFLLVDRYPLLSKRGPDGQLVFGTAGRDGNVLLRVPAYRVRAVARLDRLPGTGDKPLSAWFKAVVHGASPEDVRWSGHLELPAGQQSVAVPFEADAVGKPLLFWVSQPAENGDGGFAGFRDLEITHALESAEGAPRLRPDVLPETPAAPALADSFFGSIAWRPQQLVVRGGQPAAAGLELAGGGEVWVHTDNMTGEIRGQLSRTGGAGAAPGVRIVWYKGGRLQLIQQGSVESDRPFDFHVWTAEPGGWIGILLVPGTDVAPAQVRVSSTTLAP